MTPHIEAKKGDIAKTVIMPGDPLRAKVIAEKYLENAKLVNSVRNMFAYTGTYKGVEITVFSSGMGMPSAGIYSYELFNEYGVENIVRVGSAGSYRGDINLYDLVLAESSYSQSTYAKVQNGEEKDILYGSSYLNNIILDTAKSLNKKINYGRLNCSDVFYKSVNNYKEISDNYDCLAVEMESFAIFHNANVLGKNAACIVTVSDSFVTNEETTSAERQNSFNAMMELALEAAIKF